MAKFGFGRKRRGDKAAGDADENVVAGPSPDPATNLILADIALRGGGTLLRHAVERGLLGRKLSDEKAKNVVAGRSIGQSLIGAALARVATTSVPGAIVVGGGLIAKTLYDRSKSRREARAEGEHAIAEQAKRGK